MSEMFLKGIIPGAMFSDKQYRRIKDSLGVHATRTTSDGVIVTTEEYSNSPIGVALGYRPEDVDYFKSRMRHNYNKKSFIRVSLLIDYNGIKFRTKSIRKAIKWCEKMYGKQTRERFEHPYIKRTIRVNINMLSTNIGFSWDNKRKMR